MNRLPVYLFGLSAIAAGAVDAIFGAFEAAHQPLQAWGDHLPFATAFAYLVAAILLAGGIAVLSPKAQRYGALAIGAAYVIFAIFWLPRFVTAPQVLGASAAVFIGVAGGVFQQLIVVAAALLLIDERYGTIAQWTIGLGSLLFGLTHLTGIPSAAPSVPPFMPFGTAFWVVLTGIAFVLAGIAILVKLLDALAARLLALMLFVFSALSLAPAPFKYPHSEIAWGANAYNLIAVAAVWIFAEYLTARQVRAK